MMLKMGLINIIYKNINFLLKNLYFIFKYGLKNKDKFFLALKISVIFILHNLKKIIFFNKYKNEKKIFNFYIKEKNFSHNWFSENIPVWVSILKSIKEDKINCLEIGSYEGMSALFTLKNFTQSQIDCVETFEGSDEHYKINFSNVEKNFHQNLINYKNRYNIYKMTSDNFFLHHVKDKTYDLIYIDGNHHSKQVYKDAYNSFNCLKKNGVLIFDDFLKKYYLDINENPIDAIFRFIIENKNKIIVIYVGYQIFIKKII